MGSPREKVAVQIGGQLKKATTGKVFLDPLKAGGPFQLVVKGRHAIVLNNVPIGEVWICSGQSKMEWRVRCSNDAGVKIAKTDHPARSGIQPVRYFSRFFYSLWG